MNTEAMDSALLDLRQLRLWVAIDLDHVRDRDGITARATVQILNCGHIAGSTTYHGDAAVRLHALVREQILGFRPVGFAPAETVRRSIAGRIWHHLTGRKAG